MSPTAKSTGWSHSPGAANVNRWHMTAIGLGSNLGERERNLARAAIAIAGRMLAPRLSPLVVSPAQDSPPGSPDYLNAVLVGLTRTPPPDLLGLCKALEHRAGRRHDERNAPRVLDCDLLIYGDATSDQRELTLPHPRLGERPFWTQPLAVVAAELPAAVEATGLGATERLRWRRWNRAFASGFKQAGIQVTAPPGPD